MIIAAPDNSFTRLVSDFNPSGNFTISVSGSCFWSGNPASGIRNFAGLAHSGSTVNQDLQLYLLNDTQIYTNDSHYLINLNDILVPSGNTVQNFLVKFVKTVNNIDTYYFNGSQFSLIDNFTIDNTNQELFMEFVHTDELAGLPSGYLQIDQIVFQTDFITPPLYIYGKDISQDDLNLSTWGFDNSSGSLRFSMFGAEEPLNSSCPIRSPLVAIQISDELVGIYQGRIDALINQLGKNVLLEFNPLRSPCPNCEYDTINKRSTGIYIPGGPRPFDRGRRCPYCKGEGLLTTPVTKCIQCLIKWNPRDNIGYQLAISENAPIVRLKTFMTSANDMIRCVSAVIDENITESVKTRVKMVRKPLPQGLRESRYCISYWRVIEG